MSPFQTIPPVLQRGVIIHHWDTDGLVSAAILRNYFNRLYPDKQVDTFVPTITNYYLTEEQLTYLGQQHYGFVITCDLNFPGDTVQQLARAWPNQVYFFDHHHHPEAYPNVHYYNQPHPSCASFISETLGLAHTILAVIAMVGDREESIQRDPVYYPVVREIMAEYDITFSQLLQLRRLIDSNYIVDDYQGISETIHLLQHDPLAVLADVRLQSHLLRITQAVESILQQPLEHYTGVVDFLEMTTTMNVVSYVTRVLSRQQPDHIIFTRQLKGDHYTCYVRRRNLKLDIRAVIQFAHELGLNAGGKEEVVGIIIPQERSTDVFPKLKNFVCQLQPM